MYDHAVVGGGILGLAVAAELLRRKPGARVVVLEKEDGPARHQTGRNSGVIHSGLYYVPGSLKARLCVAGARSMVEFCQQHGVAHAVTGKVVVATEPWQLKQLDVLFDRGTANGVPVRRITAEEVGEHEPHVRCLAGLHVASTGIADFAGVAAALAKEIEAGGGEIRFGAQVTAVRGNAIETSAGSLTAGHTIACAGLHGDRVARLWGLTPPARIVPFRGEYHELRPHAAELVRGLIYPVPDPAFPFLGVHFTRGIDGHVHAGPNAVLALAREGYRWRDFRPRDLAGSLAYPGTRRLIARHWRTGAGEVHRSLSKRAFVKALQRLVPEIGADDLVRAPAGVRAQALRPDGGLVDDFLFAEGPNSLHVVNAPSPAATASLEIAKEIVDRSA